MLVESIKYFQDPLFSIDINNVVNGTFNFHVVVDWNIFDGTNQRNKSYACFQ